MFLQPGHPKILTSSTERVSERGLAADERRPPTPTWQTFLWRAGDHLGYTSG